MTITKQIKMYEHKVEKGGNKYIEGLPHIVIGASTCYRGTGKSEVKDYTFDTIDAYVDYLEKRVKFLEEDTDNEEGT